MTEKYLIDLLSDESEKMTFEAFEDKDRFDTDICGWKDINPAPALVRVPCEMNKFRIRSSKNKDSMIRSSSSNSYLSTYSSGNSRNNSPGRDPGECKKKQRQLFVGNQEPLVHSKAVGISGLKPPRARKNRKPVKVFKLPNVNQENDE